MLSTPRESDKLLKRVAYSFACASAISLCMSMAMDEGTEAHNAGSYEDSFNVSSVAVRDEADARENCFTTYYNESADMRCVERKKPSPNENLDARGFYKASQGFLFFAFLSVCGWGLNRAQNPELNGPS